jgi:hypothetical protein
VVVALVFVTGERVLGQEVVVLPLALLQLLRAGLTAV